jgi:hypothetical protein
MGECSEEAVEGAPGDQVGLPQQFVEQVVCVLPAESASTYALRGRRKGILGRPGT